MDNQNDRDRTKPLKADPLAQSWSAVTVFSVDFRNLYLSSFNKKRLKKFFQAPGIQEMIRLFPGNA